MNGVHIVDVLLETVGAADKENARKNKPRAGSVPPRSTTPSYSNNNHVGSAPRGGSGTVTPAVRPSSSMSMAHSQSVPNKRPRLGTSTSTASGRAPLGSANANPNMNSGVGGMSSNAHPHKANKTPTSSLPRPAARHPTHPPMPINTHSRNEYGPAGIGMGYATSLREQQQNRITSTASLATTATTFAVMGAAALKGHVASNGLRASRNRRESFKPRPSMDSVGTWAGAEGVGGRWGGFAGSAVQEEDEY